jgi:hypothetical protein
LTTPKADRGELRHAVRKGEEVGKRLEGELVRVEVQPRDDHTLPSLKGFFDDFDERGSEELRLVDADYLSCVEKGPPERCGVGDRLRVEALFAVTRDARGVVALVDRGRRSGSAASGRRPPARRR